MKKVIGGKVYNTETATLIGEWSYGYPNDFNYVSEGLYKTPKGAYFMAGEGGANTAYSRPCGQNCWTGSEDIVPMTRQEAFEWAQRYLEPKEFEEEFADLIEEA